MTDKDHKEEKDDYAGPPDYVPDHDLPPAAIEARRAAGRVYSPHPTCDYDSTTGELVPRVKAPEKKSFFDKKKE